MVARLQRLLTFRVKESRYAIPADVISELVDPMPTTHEVPAADGNSLSLAWVRERWVPVVELADLVAGVAPLGHGGDAALLVLGLDGALLAVGVAALDGVLQIDGEKISRERGLDDLIEVDGDLVRYVDPAKLVPPGSEFSGEKGGSMESDRETREALQLITFRVGGEDFGIDVAKVQRVLNVPQLRTVPNAPDFVEGLMSVGESVIPVIDVRKRFGLTIDNFAAADRLVTVDLAGKLIGLVVDEVPGVVRVDPDSIAPAPDFFKGLASRFIHGIVDLHGRLVILLDLDEILSSTERIELEQMMDTV
jgi:purine-binding chemotaxis protein CheW